MYEKSPNEGYVKVSVSELEHLRKQIELIIYRQEKQDENSCIMDITETSHYIRYSKASIYKFVRSKKIPFKKTAGKLLFHKKELDKWLISKEE